MRDKPYAVRVRPEAHTTVRKLPNIGERTKARQSLIDRLPFPGSFATYGEAQLAAKKAGPEFEVVVQS